MKSCGAALALAIAVSGSSAARADDVGEYLQRLGLKSLLAVHLESQLEVAKGADRDELVLQLASLYAELLESTTEPAQRIELEDRSKRLLAMAPPRGADPLRMALLRVTCRWAEKTAELHRLRLASPDDLALATRAFDEAVPQLQALRQQFHAAAEVAERRHGRSAGPESIALGQAARQARGMYAQCTFLTAWALYYQGWLNRRPESAKAAEPMFAELLGAESPTPIPSDVPLDSRSEEAVARAILGMALCKSLTASPATALAWIELLEHEGVFAGLREQAPAWQIAINLEHAQFGAALQVLQSQQAAGNDVPLAWWRLAAVMAMESASRARSGDDLARAAITELATRGELEQVMDLASRYGTQFLGQAGFASSYVRAVIAYRQARAAHGSEEPATDPELAAMYEQAAVLFQAAIQEPDASDHQQARGACRRLLAWCRFFQARFSDAAEAFQAAARELSGPDAAEAAWMAIVAFERLVQTPTGTTLQPQLAVLIERFLQTYPQSPHGPTLVLRESMNHSAPSAQDIEKLLAIEPSSEVYQAARQRAADLIFQMFRAAPASERYRWSNQFLDVAMPLIGPASISEAAGDDLQRLAIRCRQTLEVALAPGIERREEARLALARLDELRDEHRYDLSDCAAEIDCRRAQERLIWGDADAASQLIDAMWQRDRDSIWSRLAVRSMFKWAYARLRDASTPQHSQDDLRMMVVKYGGRVLHEFGTAAEALDKPGVVGYHLAVAEASMELWERTGDADRGKGALFLYERLLAKNPRSAPFLHATAILSERFGEPQKALGCWRRLIAGTSSSSIAWFEAKFHLLRLLAQLDPPRAREVMDQHKLLNPGYGPDPWGAQIKGLDEQIPRATSSSAGNTGNERDSSASPVN